VVRQRILIPPFPGSSPGIPANLCGLFERSALAISTSAVAAGLRPCLDRITPLDYDLQAQSLGTSEAIENAASNDPLDQGLPLIRRRAFHCT
jgi:hypothetical protein